MRKKLSDILGSTGNGNNFRERWDSTAAADDFGPLPVGEYDARLDGIDLATGRTNGTPGVKLTFIVCEGEHTGRRIWHDVWLTDAALPMAKRDLGKLGIASLDQLDGPMPPGIICRLRVTLRKGDDGAEFNRVKSFDLLRIEAPDAEPFAPAEPTDPPSNPPTTSAAGGDV